MSASVVCVSSIVTQLLHVTPVSDRLADSKWLKGQGKLGPNSGSPQASLYSVWKLPYRTPERLFLSSLFFFPLG